MNIDMIYVCNILDIYIYLSLRYRICFYTVYIWYVSYHFIPYDICICILWNKPFLNASICFCYIRLSLHSFEVRRERCLSRLAWEAFPAGNDGHKESADWKVGRLDSWGSHPELLRSHGEKGRHVIWFVLMKSRWMTRNTAEEIEIHGRSMREWSYWWFAVERHETCRLCNETAEKKTLGQVELQEEKDITLQRGHL